MRHAFELRFLDERHELREVLVRLAREPDDARGANGGIGNDRAHLLHTVTMVH